MSFALNKSLEIDQTNLIYSRAFEALFQHFLQKQPGTWAGYRENLPNFLNQSRLALLHKSVFGSDAELAEHTAKLKIHQTILLSGAKSISEQLAVNGIDSIFIKGVPLACFAYPAKEYREFSDIDILVKPEDVKKSIATLAQLGFRPQRTLSEKKFKHEINTQHALTLISERNCLELDLHWRLVQIQYGFADSTNELWQSRTSKNLNGSNVSIPSAEEHMMFLVIHAAKNYWQDLRFFFDIIALSQAEKFSWFALQEYAERTKQKTILAISLLLAERVIGLQTPITEEVSTWLVDTKVVDRISQNLVERTEISEFSALKLDLEIKDSIFQKLRYLCLRIFIPHEEDWNAKIPDSLFILHFIRKPLKLSGRVFKLLLSKG